MKFRFVTITNKGYYRYTQNCMESLKISPDAPQLECYFTDKLGYDQYKTNNNVHYIGDKSSENESEQLKFRKGNWISLVGKKISVISKILQTGDCVIITDGDIVYKHPQWFNYIKEKLSNPEVEFLIMNDMLSDDDHDLLCSGFMVLKPTENNMKHFNEGIDISDLPGDQVYVNNIKSELKYEVLPLDKFPNGRLHHATTDPYALHYNFMIGNTKEQKMIKSGNWLI